MPRKSTLTIDIDAIKKDKEKAIEDAKNAKDDKDKDEDKEKAIEDKNTKTDIGFTNFGNNSSMNTDINMGSDIYASQFNEEGKIEEGKKKVGKIEEGKKEEGKKEVGKKEVGKIEEGKIEEGKKEEGKKEEGKKEEGKKEEGKIEEDKDKSKKNENAEKDKLNNSSMNTNKNMGSNIQASQLKEANDSGINKDRYDLLTNRKKRKYDNDIINLKKDKDKYDRQLNENRVLKVDDELDAPKTENYYQFDFKKRVIKPLFNKLYPLIVFIIYILIIILLILYILTIFKYIILTLIDIVKIIFNDDIINYNTIAYKTVFKYLNTAKDNYLNEPFYIFLEQYLSYRTIDVWFIGFLFLGIPYAFYLFILLYYKFKGDIYSVVGGVEFQKLVLQLMAVYMFFLILHVYVYKKIFTDKLYKEFKEIKIKCLEIDQYIYDRLWFNDCVIYYDDILENNDINKINNYINEGIKNSEDEGRKKIFTYILYRYLTENIEISRTGSRTLVRNYLTYNIGENKLLTFISLLNYKKKIIKKYYTELNFTEYFITSEENNNKVLSIKDKLDNDINNLNKKIINSPSFRKAYFYLFLFIICMFFINLIFVIIISYMIVYDDTPLDESIVPNSLREIIKSGLDKILYIKNIIGL